MRNSPKARLPLHAVSAAALILCVACSAPAQNCPGGNPPRSNRNNPTDATFCCNSQCCAPAQDANGNWVLGLPGVSGVESTNSFATNFITGSAATDYETMFPYFQTGSTGAGDMNARYGALYYSISSTDSINNYQTNLSNWESTCGTGPTGAGCTDMTPGNLPFCAVELVVAGQYPNARYFSISNYDDHYTISQHIADLDVDTYNTTTNSPFQNGGTWTSSDYLHGAGYAVPYRFPAESIATPAVGLPPSVPPLNV